MLDTPPMLVELSVMEQRYQAVLVVIHDGVSGGGGGAAVRRVASDGACGGWRRYEAGRAGGVGGSVASAEGVRASDAGRRSRCGCWRCGGSIRTGDRAGCCTRLGREGIDPLPSRSGIYRLLKRPDLIDPNARRRRDRKFKRWERGRAMELWQMDVVGGILLADGTGG